MIPTPTKSEVTQEILDRVHSLIEFAEKAEAESEKLVQENEVLKKENNSLQSSITTLVNAVRDVDNEATALKKVNSWLFFYAGIVTLGLILYIYIQYPRTSTPSAPTPKKNETKFVDTIRAKNTA